MEHEFRFESTPEPKIDWMHHLHVLRRRRWWFILPAFLIWAAVWIASWFLPAIYRSETVIVVEQQRVPSQYVVANVGDDLQQRLQSMTQQILSRTRLLRIMEEFNLYGHHGKREADALVEAMRKDIQIEMVRSSNYAELSAFKIAYLSRNPETAKLVVSQLSSLFIEENLRARQQQSEDTTEFLDSELEQARISLAAQEEKVRDFKSRYLGELPGQLQSNVQILAGLQSRREQEMSALAQARQQSVYLESMLHQLRGVEADMRVGKSGLVQAPVSLDNDIERLQTQLAELSSRYSDEHPDVRKLKTQLANAQRLKEAREAELAKATKTSSSEESTVRRPSSYADVQAMSPRLQAEGQLKANRLEIENRQRSINDIERQIGAYQGRLNTSPLREQQLADITRDYDQSRKNYEQLLAKRDQSEMATNLEKRQQGERFRVIDPPNVPQKPYSPDRFKMALAGLGAGVFFGFVSVVGLEIADDRIHNRETLQEIVSAPILVEVPALLTASEEKNRARSNFLQLIAILAILLTTVAGIGASHFLG
jgi:succinoglycan biosynthesis transport protein ExoP